MRRCCSSSIRAPFAKSLAGKKVVVCDYPDGRLEIMEGSTSLPYKTFDKLTQSTDQRSSRTSVLMRLF